MKSCFQKSKVLRAISAGACVFALLANNAWAVLSYWDPEGRTGSYATYTGGSLSGTWETVHWARNATGGAGLPADQGTNAPLAWTESDAAVFAVGAGATNNLDATSTTAFTVTANANHSVAGFFIGALNPNSCIVTLNGSGIFTLPGTSATLQGVNIANSSDASLGQLIISNTIAGAAVLTPQGNGQIFLRGANTWTGGTMLGYSGGSWSGVVNFNSAASFGTGAITLGNTATVTGGMVYEGTGAVSITNAFKVASIAAIPAPKLNIVGNPAGLTFSGPWTLSTNVTIGSGNVAANLVNISGAISGGFTFGKANVGILQFTATNTYTGNTTVSNGVLQLGDGVGRNGAVAGTITVTSPGALVWANPTALTYAKAISGSGAVTNKGPGVLTLTVVDTYNGGTAVIGGTLKQGIANVIPNGSGKGDVTVDGGTFDLGGFASAINGLNGGSGGIVDNSSGAGPFTLTIGNNSANGSFAGAIKNTTGTVALTKAGSGTLTLSGTNAYSGVTTINAGTLQLGASGSIPAASIVIFTNGATLDMNNLNGTNAALNGTGSIINNNGTLSLSGNGNGPAGQIFNAYSSFAGSLSGGGTLLKAGTHAMGIRSDVSSYGGSVVLNGGTLSVGAAPNRLPTGMTLSVPGGALFQLDANSQTVGSLNGSGSVNLGGGTLTVNQNGSDSFNGVIQNSELAGSSTALGHGLRGYYYTNVDLTGLSTVRDDAVVLLADMTALPGYTPTAKTNQVSVRWLGQVLSTVAGAYTFSTRCDDGQRLWVNGTLLVDDWNTHGATTKSGTITLAANTRYDIVMEFFQNGGGGSAQLLWTPPGDSSVVIPTANLFLPGPGTLVKSGGGMQQLAAASTYSGGTVVSGGTLQATNGAVGSGNVSVADGAILELDSPTTMNSAADLVMTPATINVYLNFTGQNNIHGISFDGGASYGPTGTYGPTGSGANHENPVFTGSGFLNVAANPTTNTLTASAGTVVYASGLILTSTITGSGGTATGAVTFYDNGNFLGTSVLDGLGVATLSVSNLLVTASPHSLVAVYGGDATHATSSSAAVPVTTTPGTVVPIPVIAARAYDGTSNATIASITFGGILDSDTNYVHISGAYTAFFSDQYVGVNKSVSVTNLVLTGSLSGNYVLFTNAVSSTGSITNKVLTISGITATNRLYNATTNEGVTGAAVLNAGVVSPDVVTLGGSGVFAFLTKNSGTNKPVTVSGYTLVPNPGIATNYLLVLTNLSATITNFPIGINGLTANPKVYDGGTNATLSGVAALNPTAFAGDDVTLGGTPVASFATATVGAAKPVTVTGYTISGLDVANYTLSQPTGLTADIAKASTTATITSSVNPSALTSNVTFKCTVTANTPTTNPPTLTVTFFTNGIVVTPSVLLVSNTPTSSTASFSTTLLPAGTNTVAAQYPGDANFLAALQVSTNQVVQSSTVCSQTNVISSIVANGGNSFTLNFIGTYQAQYYVVAQTNVAQPMINWVPVPGTTNTVTNVVGLWSVTVTNPAPAYYRSKAMNVCP